MDAYDIPSAEISVTEESIKKSRFITFLAHTEGAESARDFVRQIKSQHPDARHHCWAWVAGAPDDSQQLGFSDDGEPSGTAGKPMLAQLMGSGLGEVTAVVVRYYGGVMLGTGGLVKAYGGGVRQGLSALTRTTKVPMQTFTLCCDYRQLDDIERLVERHQGKMIRRDYQADIILTLALPHGRVGEFTQHLSDFSRGRLMLQRVNQLPI
ncbi:MULTISPECIES: IMPACT family protein [Tatumella]|uniref:IMPACT family protein n=1 Tax=Tatumella punctata TaxID=399969 RepID=A0ABW1VRV7_9GAMM|nr:MULTISPECIES: IMPACT family protein [unclassified Tatumella]MBS0857138.1 IMPACT family protein [Tatumella sp. JGM16]MBS0894048.1 IMPACT family protein [Tatumella sp. JGM130]MBS0913891.1 IMPACT family protein [Tatumella sp. JGM91]